MKLFYSKYGKWIRVVAFIMVFCMINQFLSINLVESALSRIIIHEMSDETEDYDCVVFGESHSSYAIDPEVIEEESDLSTMSVSIGGEYMMDMYYLVQEMYDTQSPSVVVLDLDYQYFINIPSTQNTVMSTLVYNNYPFSLRKLSYAYDKLLDKEYRAALFPWVNSRDNLDCMDGIFWLKRTDAYKNYDASAVTQIDPSDTYKGNGFIYRSHSYVRDESNTVGIWWNEPKVDYTASVEYLKKIVDYCESQGSTVVMMTTPINTETLFGSASEYNQIEEYFAMLAEETGLTYYNFNLIRPEYYIRNTTDYWDFDGHMYGDAAEEYSSFLGDFIRQISEGEEIDVSNLCYSNIYDMQENYEEDVQNVLNN